MFVERRKNRFVRRIGSNDDGRNGRCGGDRRIDGGAVHLRRKFGVVELFDVVWA